MFLECEWILNETRPGSFLNHLTFLSQVIISVTSVAASTENKEEKNVTLYLISFMAQISELGAFPVANQKMTIWFFSSLGTS